MKQKKKKKKGVKKESLNLSVPELSQLTLQYLHLKNITYSTKYLKVFLWYFSAVNYTQAADSKTESTTCMHDMFGKLKLM